MDLAANPSLWLLVPAIPVALWAIHSDLSRMIIPNRAVLTLLAVFVVVGGLALPLPEFGTRLGIGALALVAGFVGASLGWFGAGDAKFFAAMAPFVGPGDWAVFGIVLAIASVGGLILHRAARATPLRAATPDWESWTRRDFPMGLSLGAALICYLALGAAQ